MLAAALLDGEVEEIVAKVIEQAKEGDATALRLTLERILPPRKDRPIAFEMPVITSASDALACSAALVQAVGKGTLTCSEASELGTLIQAHIKVLETVELEQRITALERARRQQ
jgi:hypothetical protein